MVGIPVGALESVGPVIVAVVSRETEDGKGCVVDLVTFSVVCDTVSVNNYSIICEHLCLV